MKIAIIADPYIPIPPEGYGGIERIIDMLIKGYLKRGHRITLWAHPDSKVDCELMPYGIVPHWGLRIRMLELWQVMGSLYKMRKKFDIIHSFGRLAGMLPLYFSKIPKIQSYQRSISRRNVWLASKLAGKSIFFTACSDNCRKYGNLPGNWQTVYNGIPMENYEFTNQVSSDAPLVFLGRIEKEKGVHTAIEVALAAGRKLIIAGNVVRKGNSYTYFKEQIEPRIDGERIEYIGEVNDEQKNTLLQKALVLLMPVEYDEPGAVVICETLACGTPIIGFRRGCIPEVTQEGVNGFVCDDKEEMVELVKRIAEIDRKKCRETFESRFSSEVIAQQYIELYERLLA